MHYFCSKYRAIIVNWVSNDYGCKVFLLDKYMDFQCYKNQIYLINIKLSLVDIKQFGGYKTGLILPFEKLILNHAS